MQCSFSHAEIDDLVPDLIALRRDLHAHPELAFEERRTSGIVAAELGRLHIEVHEGLAGTGVVGTLRHGHSTRTIGLRADMDALPITEQSQLAHASRHAGVHHGCGHDGHTAMLLGAARHLARTRRFDGTIHFIFQPAEEGRGGARVMLEQGLLDRFPCDAVYALHNWPDLPAGHAQTWPGPIMAAADRFDIILRGRGGHAAQPHRTPDVLLAAS
jgi:amidohydrolase